MSAGGVATDAPAATVELARLGDELGVISLDVRNGRNLVLGNEILGGLAPTYPAHERHGVSAYRVEAIANALRELAVEPPVGASADLDAVGVFAGYITLDALVGNLDRHHENWGILIDVTGGTGADAGPDL